MEKFEVKRVKDDIFDIGDFVIKDELYIHELEPGIDVHFTAKHKGRDIPVVWTYHYGKGNVCYAVPGHTTGKYEKSVCTENFAARIEMGDRMNKLKIAIVGCGDIAGFTAIFMRLESQYDTDRLL